VDYTFYLYPGNEINVSTPAKVVVTALAVGELPPVGATVIPTPPVPSPASVASLALDAHVEPPAPLEIPTMIIRTQPTK
jgi:hypothetical protein